MAVHEHEQTQQAGGRPTKPQEKEAPSIVSQIGNTGLARLLEGADIARSGRGPAQLDREIARAIDAQRGRGRELDNDARSGLETAMGEDFSDVRIHDDAEAHELSKSVSAEAFTTGSDVFFQSGKYDPASSEGKKLLAHELTHVVQQRGATPTTEMTVSDPGDASEVEASAVAERVSSAQPSAAQPSATVSREAEEEELQASRVDRQEDEEEPAQG